MPDRENPTDVRGRNLHKLGHDPKELEQPFRQYEVDEVPSQVGSYIERENEDGSVTTIDTGHKPGTPRPRPDDGPDNEHQGDLPAGSPLKTGEEYDPASQYARPNIVRPPYGGA